VSSCFSVNGLKGKIVKKQTRRDFLAETVGGALVALTPKTLQPSASEVEKSNSTGIKWQKTVPVRYQADVAVVGGGIAGVAAACAAAKSGVRVVLVERFGVTGGNCTVGGVASFCGETAGQGEIFDEIIQGLEAFNAVAPYQPFAEKEHRIFDHEILAIVLQEMLLKYEVKLLLHTRFVDVVLKKSKITDLILCGKSGPEALRANIFIDCTGEGEVAHAAGFATLKGGADHLFQLPMSLMFFVRHVAGDVPPQTIPTGWFEHFSNPAELPMTSVWPNGPGGNALKIKIPKFDATDTESLTQAEIRARRKMLAVLDYYQRVVHKSWRFDHCSAQIGIREGRRVLGDYLLTVADLRAARRFDDAIARGVYPLDAHKPDDDQRTYILSAAERIVPPYQIPFRSLIAKDGVNLLVAGRCFSADQLALSSARVTTTCAMQGQAAGRAAAKCIQHNLLPRQLDYTEIRAIVGKHGARLEL